MQAYIRESLLYFLILICYFLCSYTPSTWVYSSSEFAGITDETRYFAFFGEMPIPPEPKEEKRDIEIERARLIFEQEYESNPPVNILLITRPNRDIMNGADIFHQIWIVSTPSYMNL